MAYYRTAVEICKKWSGWAMPADNVAAMFENFAQLGQGSAFFHSSQTEVGGSADGMLMDAFTFSMYQGMVANLEPLDSTLIHELSYTPR